MPSKLRDKKQNMCCLGFLALDCGAKPRDIISKAGPCRAPKVPWPEKVVYGPGFTRLEVKDTPWTEKAMVLNDEINITMKKRKSALVRHFRKINYQLKFV